MVNLIPETELTEAINGIEGTLTTEQSNKLNELLPYKIGTTTITNSVVFPIIPTDGTDRVMEIGQYLDFHTVNNDLSDYKARLTCNDTNSLILNTGTFGCSIVSVSSLRTPLIKNNVSGGSLQYKNFADTTLLIVANDGSTTFAGEISTPTFNSLNVNSTISTLQNGFNYVDQQINNLIADFSGLVTEPELFAVQSSVNTFQTDLLTAQGKVGKISLFERIFFF